MQAPAEPNPSAPNPSPHGEWSEPVDKLHVGYVPSGAVNLNLDGRRVSTPLKGFGQLWRKTYRLRFAGSEVSPQEVVHTWKTRFPEFQPHENRFFPTLEGIHPGELVFITGKLPPLPGLPAFLPVSSGVLVLYADDTSFSIVTPEGFPEAGYNTWSAFRDPDGVTVAQVQTFARTADPLYEFFYRGLGINRHQDSIWSHVLRQLAAAFGIQGQVEIEKICIDTRLQWRAVGAIWQNAAIRTVFYGAAAPLRWLRRGIRGPKPNEETKANKHGGLIDP